MTYRFVASDIDRPAYFLGFLFVFEAVRKYGIKNFPEHLRDAVRIDGAYSLDAPEILPAGGCFSEQIDVHEFIPSQQMFYRELT